MIRLVAMVMAGIVVMLATGCVTGTRAAAPAREERFEFVRVCMGVRTVVTMYGPDHETALGDAAAAFARIGQLEEVLSDYQPRSEVMRLCAGVREESGVGKPVRVSDDLFETLRVCEEISRATEGAFDVTMGPAVRLWRETRRSGVMPSEAELAAARAAIGWQNVRLDAGTGPGARTVALMKRGMLLDFGGIAKGHAAECAVKVLRARGRPRCLVALAGDFAAGDPPPGEKGWKIEIAGLRRHGAESADATLLLANGAVSTAGGEEQFVEIGGTRYSHIIDPRTLLGMTARRSVTVVSVGDGCGARADGLDTAVCVVGAEQGRAMIGRFAGAGAVVREETGEVRVIDVDRGLRWAQ